MATGGFIQITEGAGKKLATGPTYTENANVVQDEKVVLGEQYFSGYTVASTSAGVSTSTAASHVLQIMAGASLKVRIRRIELWQAGLVPATVLAAFEVRRLSTAGTGGSALTPSPLEPADGASGAAAMTLPTVKGTEGVLLASSYPTLVSWQSEPLPGPAVVWDWDRPRLKALVIPAGAANGIAIKNINANTGGLIGFNVWFDEAAF